MTQSSGPLAGVTVIDVTAGLAGPYATFLLAGMGARVIKIELPAERGVIPLTRNSPPFLGRDGISMIRRHPDDVSLGNLQRLRGVESITLDIKKGAGLAVFFDLIRRADILFENRARGAMKRLGAGYPEVSAANPAIVYTSISGAGQDDTTGAGKTIDTVVQAMSGFMMTSGDEGDPPSRNGVPLADLMTPVFAVVGTLAALHAARATQKGQHVDVSMLGALTTLIANDYFPELEDLGLPIRTGTTVPRLAPLGVYPAADGYVAICAITDARFRILAEAAGRPALADDERFRTRPLRMKNVKVLDAIIAEWTRTLPAAEVARTLDARGVPSGEVRDPRAALNDPRVIAHGDVVRLRHPEYGETHPVYGPGIPIKFGDHTYPVDAAMPSLGEHNQAVYRDFLGYDAARIGALAAAGVI